MTLRGLALRLLGAGATGALGSAGVLGGVPWSGGPSGWVPTQIPATLRQGTGPSWNAEAVVVPAVTVMSRAAEVVMAVRFMLTTMDPSLRPLGERHHTGLPVSRLADSARGMSAENIELVRMA